MCPLPGDKTSCSTSNAETVTTVDCSTIVQVDHGYVLPSDNEDLKKLVLHLRTQLLVLEEELKVAETTLSSVQRQKVEMEAKCAKEIGELQKCNKTLKSQLQFLQKEKAELKEQLTQRSRGFTYEALLHDPKMLKYYTGFATSELLEGFLSFLRPHIESLQFWKMKPTTNEGERRFSVPMQDQLLLTLVRLRLGLDGTDLAYRLVISIHCIPHLQLS